MRARSIGAWLAVALLAAACTDETVVYRDRDLIGGVPAASQGFLGYSNAAAKLTVCGNCHVGPQTQWTGTAHAHAWNTLAEVPARQPFCESCHTVSEMGNATEGAVAWDATRDVRFYDVQCEACHGPGLDHVRNPSAVIPLASLGVSIGASTGCGECHSGAHHPFVEEWAESGHGRVVASAAARAECAGCHSGQAALVAFGAFDAEYIEKDSASPLPIACGVCHDPHSASIPNQLRFPITAPNEEQNLCMRCHHKRGLPDIEGAPNRGPHSPEGPLLLGDAGWIPPDMPLEPGTRIIGTHGTEANPRLCAGCHLYRFTVSDQITGDFLVSSVGHRFEAIPCIDANGAPTGESDCAVTQRSFASCTTAGCHASEASARNALVSTEAWLLGLAATLEAQLAQVPASEFSPTDNRYTTAEGARFNMQLARVNGSEVHNPFLVEALLIGSIQQVQREYGIAPAGGIAVKARLQPPGAVASGD